MKEQTHVTASTKINGVAHKSNVTIDWTGMSSEDVQALAQRSIIIRKQNADRTAGIIPPERYTLKASDYKIGVRVRAEPMTPEQALAKLTPEQLTELLKSKGLL